MPVVKIVQIAHALRVPRSLLLKWSQCTTHKHDLNGGATYAQPKQRITQKLKNQAAAAPALLA